MESKQYIDKYSNMKVLGHLLKNPSLLEESDKYKINLKDFVDKTHEICFTSINNLYANGAVTISDIDIFNYIENSLPQYQEIFFKEGEGFLKKVRVLTEKDDNFDYYYNRMKKFSLLRTYVKYGVDITDFYDPNTLDFEKKNKQNRWLDNSTIADIIDLVDRKIEKIKDAYKFEGATESESLGNDIFEFLNRVEEEPSIGLPLPFGLYNTATAGARLKKLYITSAKSGLGKSRSMIANACYLSCGSYYSEDKKEWIKLSWAEPTLFVSTELEKEEIQSACLAFLSGVNEAKILGRDVMTFEERERVQQAAKVLSESKLYFEMIPDFCIEDIERIIKVNIEKNDVKYCFFDYIHTSIKLLAEIAQATRGMKLREDNILFMFSVKLKDLANKYGVFVQTGTQVNRSGNNTDEEFSSNMLRGSSAIADKADYCEIFSTPTEKDKEAYNRIRNSLGNFTLEPNFIRNIYKNRGNKYSNCRIWCHADLGTCRIYPLFCTNYSYEVIEMPILNVEVYNND